MTSRSTLTTLDEALDGAVSSLIQQRRSEGISASEIRDEIRDAMGVTVSERTVLRWAGTLELGPKDAA